MRKNLFWKVLFLSLLIAIALGVFAVFAAGRALKTDPKLLTKIERVFGLKINDFNIIFTRIGGVDAFPHASTWEYEIPAELLNISMLAGEVEIQSTEGDKVIVSAEGDLASNAQQMLDVQFSNSSELVISEPINTVTNLKVLVKVPRSFTKSLVVSSMSGDIELRALELESVNVGSASGSVAGEDLSVDDLSVASISGDITIEALKVGNISLRSTSGNVKLKVPRSDDVNLRMGSMSGRVRSTYTSNPKGKFTIEVGSTSGDVEVE